MDDLDLDRRLHEEGSVFRESHTWVAAPQRRAPRRRRALLLPIAAGVATAALVGVVALVLPSDPAPSRARPLASAGASAPPAGGRSEAIALPIQGLNDIDLGQDVVAVSYVAPGQASRGHLRVLARSNLASVVFSATTSYTAGTLSCLALDGNWLLWTDNESIPSDLDPGPLTRSSVWVADLRTGDKSMVQERRATDALADGPCPSAAHGTAAWNPSPWELSKMNLASGTVATGASTSSQGRVEAVLPSGVLLTRFHNSTMQIVLLAADGSERVVREVPGGLQLVGAGDRVVWFEKDPGSDTEDAGLVRTCTLPTCSDARLLAKDPSSGAGVIGAGFVAWSGLGDSPALRRFDGGPVPSLAPGYVSFGATAALGSTFAYVTTTDNATPAEKNTLHLVEMP